MRDINSIKNLISRLIIIAEFIIGLCLIWMGLTNNSIQYFDSWGILFLVCGLSVISLGIYSIRNVVSPETKKELDLFLLKRSIELVLFSIVGGLFLLFITPVFLMSLQAGVQYTEDYDGSDFFLTLRNVGGQDLTNLNIRFVSDCHGYYEADGEYLKEGDKISLLLEDIGNAPISIDSLGNYLGFSPYLTNDPYFYPGKITLGVHELESKMGIILSNKTTDSNNCTTLYFENQSISMVCGYSVELSTGNWRDVYEGQYLLITDVDIAIELNDGGSCSPMEINGNEYVLLTSFEIEQGFDSYPLIGVSEGDGKNPRTIKIIQEVY